MEIRLFTCEPFYFVRTVNRRGEDSFFEVCCPWPSDDREIKRLWPTNWQCAKSMWVFSHKHEMSDPQWVKLLDQTREITKLPMNKLRTTFRSELDESISQIGKHAGSGSSIEHVEWMDGGVISRVPQIYRGKRLYFVREFQYGNRESFRQVPIESE